jgi:ubiquinone/menaquinone biosynthesis C-methylase UbiE
MKTQKDAFLKYEADNWFSRNKSALEYSSKNDMVLKILKEYAATPGDVLEIGCSTGYRLNAIKEQFEGSTVTGLEPSADAIRFGKEKYQGVNFIQGTADDLQQIASASFNLVIIGFVFYVVDREMLFKAVAETDRVLKNGGTLMIIDFFSEKPVRNPYQHITDMEAFAFKQNYEEIFLASKLYQLIDKRSMSHANKGYDLSGDYYNKYCVTTLRKDLSASYK